MKIVFQGDSVTDSSRKRDSQDSGGSLGEGYVLLAGAKLQAKYQNSDIQVYNRGISGNRVVDLYARWKVDCLNLSPDILSILIGVNDTWHGKDAADNGIDVPRYEKIYRDILEWTVDALPDIKLVLCEPFVLHVGAVEDDWLPEIQKRQAVVRRLTEEFDAIFVPFQSLFDRVAENGLPEYWLRDGVHPTNAGHSIMADFWIENVMPKILDDYNGIFSEDESCLSVDFIK